jgi:hypothetical protein
LHQGEIQMEILSEISGYIPIAILALTLTLGLAVTTSLSLVFWAEAAKLAQMVDDMSEAHKKELTRMDDRLIAVEDDFTLAHNDAKATHHRARGIDAKLKTTHEELVRAEKRNGDMELKVLSTMADFANAFKAGRNRRKYSTFSQWWAFHDFKGEGAAELQWALKQKYELEAELRELQTMHESTY